MTDEELHKEATLRVKEKKKFKSHRNSFLSMMLFFFLINVFSSPGVWWFYWPMLGWGIGLFAHYQKVYGPSSKRNHSEWDQKQYQKEIKRLKKQEPIPRTEKPKDKPLDLNEDKLELEDFKELRKEWDDSELV